MERVHLHRARLGLAYLVASLVAMPATATEIAYDGAARPTIGVTARIVAGCSIVNGISPGTLDLGTLDFGAHPVSEMRDQSTTTSGADSGKSLRCTPSTVVRLTLSAGVHADANGQRYLANGGAKIPYDVWTDATKAVALKSNQAQSLSLPSGTMPLSLYSVARLSSPSVGGRIAGTYSDRVEVRLDF